MLAIVPATFDSTSKPDCYYNLKEISYNSQQSLFAVPVLKIFDTKLPVYLLCTIISTSPDGVILPKNQHIGEMKPLINIDDSVNTPAVSEVTHEVNSDCIDTQCTKPDAVHPPHVKSTATHNLCQKHLY